MTLVKAAILAGGQGARFWPVSRRQRPKQFLKLGAADESLIQSTARRIEPLVGRSNIMVVTNDNLIDMVKEHVPHAQTIGEPCGRNTAASIGLAAIFARKENPDSIIIVLPADHSVKDEDKLRQTLKEAIELAEADDVLVTIGIPPAGPNTAYGYIQRGQRIHGRCCTVKRFYEKPSFERALHYVESGDYFWNSGMFVWRTETILKSIKQLMPQLYEGLCKIEKAIGTELERATMQEVFATLDSISIDFGILELARNCTLVEAIPFGWNDVGSWDAWAEHFDADGDGNLLHGDALVIESRGCIVHSDTLPSHKRLTALLGVENLVVIDAGDAVLICPRERVQDVRKVVDALKQKNRTELI